ncbi:MAG TPA: GIDE domain-containing protein [Gammaproteobacteria bacterium]
MFSFLNTHWIVTAAPDDFWFAADAAIVIAVAGLAGFLLFLRRLRFVEETPQSLIRSAAQGYVELQGSCRLMPGEPIIAPLTQQTCVWWSYSIEQKNRSGNNRVTWNTVQRRTSDDLFFIDDGTGHCAVDPDRAVIYPSIKQVWYGNTEMPEGGPGLGTFGLTASYRYSESRIDSDDPLYALGYFHTQGVVGMGEINEEVRQLLVEWKQNQAALIARFDTNHDGQIDQQEWEAAREEARKEILAQEREAMSRPPINVLSRPPDGRPFILSTAPQKKLETRLRLYIAASLLAFFVAGAVSARLLTVRLAGAPDSASTQQSP